MSKKDNFLKELYNALETRSIKKEEIFSAESLDFLERLSRVDILLPDISNTNSTQEVKNYKKSLFTENGAKILIFMQNNKDKYNNTFNSKTIGEGINLSSRSVSGSLQKLVKEEYVKKISLNPTYYGLTEKGIDISVN